MIDWRWRMLVPALLALAACGEIGSVQGDAGRDTSGYDTETVQADPSAPAELPFVFTREPAGAPVTDEERAAFTDRMAAFYVEQDYLGWLLRMSHGFHGAADPRRDFKLWWEETHAVKAGATVTIVHDSLPEHGAHNSLVANAKILSAAADAYRFTGDPVAATLTAQYCQGISSSMLGMVYDEEDPLPHLMARSVVMPNHEYTTHDGYEKIVDASNWFFSYDRWNCSRFLYAQNPYWGPVWVTNTRSKDDLGYLYFAAAALLDLGAEEGACTVRDACAETLALVRAFARDIVDNGYEIRTKDANGEVYTPSNTTGPPEARTVDLASFVFWDVLFPGSECNHMQATELMADPASVTTVCPPFGGHPDYEQLAIENNPPNAHVLRFFHMSVVRLALLAGDLGRAERALEGLEERFERDYALDRTDVGMAEARWFGEMATNRLAAAVVGYPLTADEVREIHALFLYAAKSYAAWPLWNLWDEAVPDGEHRWRPPHAVKEDGTRRWWVPPYDMGLLFTYCASPFKNPAGEPPIDCDRLRAALAE